MVVEIGGEVFKGEADVRAWVEANLPTSHPFGVFVNVYIVLELILLGQTNDQMAQQQIRSLLPGIPSYLGLQVLASGKHQITWAA
eukprot:1920832-Ditylum_brightwellii.AAC.1